MASPIRHTVFCKTFGPDAKWAVYLLLSFLAHFRNTPGVETVFVIVGDSASLRVLQSTHTSHVKALTKWTARVLDSNDVQIMYINTLDVLVGGQKLTEGYVSQQLYKLYADEICPGGFDYVTFIDSDTRFIAPFSFNTVIPDGSRPLLLYESYTRLPRDAQGWAPIVKKHLGLPTLPAYEYMRRMPLTYCTSTLAGCRAKIQQVAGVPAVTAVLRSGEFSEFNVLGAFADGDPKERLLYQWQDAAQAEAVPPARVRQSWSHTPWTGSGTGFAEGEMGQSLLADVLASETSNGIVRLPCGLHAVAGDTHFLPWLATVGYDHATDIGELLRDAVLRSLQRHTQNEVAVVDAGANIGTTSLVLLDLISQHGLNATLVSFEPLRPAFTALAANHHTVSETRPDLRWHVCVAAIGDTTGFAQPAAPVDAPTVDNYGARWLNSSNHAGTGTGVRVMTLDAVFKDIKPLALVKMDIEGWEVSALRGGATVIQRDHPVLVLEINDGALKRQGATPEALFDMLQEWSYVPAREGWTSVRARYAGNRRPLQEDLEFVAA